MPWEPQAGPQTSAILADWVDELFYGGERGGGKSDFQLGYQEDGALQYGNRHRGIMFRKTYAEMEELQGRASEIFPASGGTFKTMPSRKYPFSNSWYWPSGASVKMRYIENEKDYGRYHGHSYTRISLDEVTEYVSPLPLLKMKSTMRSPYGVPCTMRATGNPGGVGHGWVKDRYVVHGPYVPYTDPETGLVMMFIPSKMSDNKILMDNDPKYRGNILAATHGNEALRKAWLEGDWDIVAGAFFESWKASRHVIKPFNPPPTWARFRSADWGSARPFSVGWYAIVQETHVAENLMGDKVILPKGCLVKYREWYGMKEKQYNVGIKMEIGEWAKEVVRRTGRETIRYTVADPSMWIESGGPSLAEQASKATEKKLAMRPADNKRIPGWTQLHSRLEGEDGNPLMVFTSSCVNTIRTLPIMQHDKLNLEDIDSDMEDHAPDETRYACMSRPRVINLPKVDKGPAPWTYDWIILQDEKNKTTRSPLRGR